MNRSIILSAAILATGIVFGAITIAQAGRFAISASSRGTYVVDRETGTVCVATAAGLVCTRPTFEVPSAQEGN